MGRGRGRDACKDAIVFFVFYVQNMDVKIVIGQIFASVKILLFGGNLGETELATVTYELGGI